MKLFFNILIMSLLFNVTSSNADNVIDYRALTEDDFKGTVPDAKGRKADALTSSGVFDNFSWGFDKDGNAEVTKAEFISRMDTTTSWFDKTLTKEEKKRLLEHEQLHFDISELIAKELQANANKIKEEAEKKINSDPVKKENFIDNIEEEISLKKKIEEKQTEIDNETDPDKKKALEDDKKSLEKNINDIRNKITKIIKENSEAYKKIKEKENKLQEDYDDETDHSREGKAQKIWQEKIAAELKKWQKVSEKTAESRAEKTLHYQANTKILSITDDLIISVDGNLSDEIIGASFEFPDYTLEGQSGFGGLIFTAENPLVKLSDTDKNILLISQMNTLFYLPDDNLFFGFFLDEIFFDNSSQFLNDLEVLLSDVNPALLTISFTPDEDFFDLTAEFTVDGEIAVSNSFQASAPIPAPSTLLLVLIGLSLFIRAKRSVWDWPKLSNIILHTKT